MSELYHHGIPGQKWGVQNGPPYPLDAQAKTVAERAAYFNSKEQRTKRLNRIGAAATVTGIGSSLAGIGAGLAGMGLGLAKNGLLGFGGKVVTAAGISALIAGYTAFVGGSINTTIATIKEGVSEIKLANSAKWIRRNIPEWENIPMSVIMDASRKGNLEKDLLPLIKNGDAKNVQINMEELLKDRKQMRDETYKDLSLKYIDKTPEIASNLYNKAITMYDKNTKRLNYEKKAMK